MTTNTNTYLAVCAQRGCRSDVVSDLPPMDCPVCGNPLLPGDVFIAPPSAPLSLEPVVPPEEQQP